MHLVIDTEVTGAQRDKGAPFNPDNKLCVVGIKELGKEGKVYKFEYDEEGYGEAYREVKELVDRASTIIWFNAKFDLHWLRRYGIRPSANCRHFDCQLAYFILTGQRHRFPSLSQVIQHFGKEEKLDVVKEEYWNVGFDTDDVPFPILSDYLLQDLTSTEQVYEALVEEYKHLSRETNKVFRVAMQDLIVLQEMEWNGMLYDTEKSLKYGEELVSRIAAIDDKIKRLAGADWFNVDSGQHLSALLYGGVIYLDGYEDYVFTYKTGKTAIKQRKVKVPHTFPRMFVPLEGTALAKEGFYSTDKATLVTLLEKSRGEKAELLEVLLERSKLEKRRGTYYQGFPKLIDKMNWRDNVIHGNLNQCTVITGRLSSDRPNLQNIEGEVKEVFKSRFPVRGYRDIKL